MDEWKIFGEGQDGDLLIAVDQLNSRFSHSLYRSLPKNARVHFKVNIYSFDVGDLVVGIGNPEDWEESGTFVVYRAAPGDELIYILLGTSGSRDPNIYLSGRSGAPLPNYELGKTQEVIFVIGSNALNIYIDKTLVAGPIFPTSENLQVFWIGYRLQKYSSLTATLSEIEVNGK